MIHYKDKTFCINQDCKKECDRKLTEHIKKEAKKFGLPIASIRFECVEKEN